MTGSDVFAQIAAVIGLPLAVRLAEQRGGGRFTVPAHAPAGHWLVELLGREAADKLCAHCRTLSPENTARGVEIDMPRGPTGTLAQARRRMAEALEQGATADAAARA
ncbi:hypothetical protein, partial [Starkeya nomas]|uniref:hypothetical protein n=1 Tax=Starkeya nomas TaxID=2666134 RepID=UPI001358B363